MAKPEPPDEGSGVGEVEITILVVPGRVQATLTKFLARPRVRAALLSAGLIAAIAAGAFIAVSSSSRPAGRPLGSGALTTQFGLRSNCARLTVFSPDGAYARVDLDRAGPCGMFGNQMTLVLHRVDGVWVRAFEASNWKCPSARVPQRVALELQLCRSNRVATATGGALSKIPLDH